MKHNFFFKLLITIVFSSFGLLGYAATPIYLATVANGGSDSNTGLTVGAPVASFSQAMSLVDAGGTIIVSGMIDMWSDLGNTTFTQTGTGPVTYSTTNKTGITIAKSITIQGTSSASDGFNGTNGANTTRFFQLTSNYALTLKNLKLTNGAIKTAYATLVAAGGAIAMSNGNIVAENVIFDGNQATGHNAIYGGALVITGTNATGTSFKNCVFSNNNADKTGAIYINTWAANSTIKFEGCAFLSNTANLAFGGSAMYIRANTAINTTLNLINCTFKGNRVLSTSSTGGTIAFGGAVATTNVNIVNCTITENTTAGAADRGAGIYYNNPTSGFLGNLYISNTIIEGNTAASGAFSDFGVNAISPATAGTGLSGSVPGYVKVQNSIIGTVVTTATNVPTGNRVSSPSYNYLISGTHTSADYRAKFGTFNTTHNCYPLLSTSTAIGYGASSYLSSLSPSISTDQIGNTRLFTGSVCDAGAIEVPRVSITSSTDATTSVNPIPVTITFSSAVTGFVSGDLSVTNGSVTSFSGSGTTYNAEITPSTIGAVTVNIAANAATDVLVGSGNVAATQFTRTYALAGTPPTVSISSTTTSNTDVSPIPITITFSESVTGFDETDLSISNGSASNFAGSGTTYTADITPAGQGNVTVDIAANAAISVSSSTGNAVATQFVRTYDTSTPPSVTISSSTSATTKSNPIPITITFSESVTGFVVGDLTVGNGNASNFAGSGTTYTADITPTASGAVTVNIAANAATGATKGNTVATQLSRTYYKDIYVSATGGNDTNNGLTVGTAVASFTKAQTLAALGETIYVSGLIDYSLEPSIVLPVGVAVTKNITIQGTDNATDGFDGKNLTRFFSIGNNTVTLKNLKLYNGYSGNNSGGAIIVSTTSGTLSCENVIFDANKTGMNTVFPAANRTGAAIQISNINGASFKNCVFSNNEASKTGAIYINNWAASSTIKFEGCSFVGNITKESTFGGSAIFIISANDNTLSLINCTFAKNEVRSTGTGGTIYAYKSLTNTVTNIINCTITENTTAGTDASGAGIYMKNSGSPDIYTGKLFIYNSIIEGNKAANNAYSDLNTSDIPTTTTLQINNCLIGRQGSTAVIPAGCFGSQNQFNYLTATSTTNDYKGGLAPFNATNNYYPLYTSSLAIGYGNSTYLTGLTPTVTTDQLGNVRTVAATNYAGAWESTPIPTTTPAAPTTLVATAGNAKISVAFTTAATGGSNVTNYKYSTDGTNFVACSPAKTTSPIVITGLTNTTAYTIKLKAVNANGDGAESAASNSVTPDATANDFVITTPTNISTLVLTPVSDVVVSSNLLTINQSTAINTLTVNPGAKVTVSGTNSLTATNGITLESSETATATLLDSYSVPTVNATVQQYVTAGRNWYISSPVSAADYSWLSRGTSVQGWNEATKAWVIITEGTLIKGKGYIQVAKTIVSPPSTTGTTGTVNVTGTTNSGNVAVTVSRTESGTSRGFNLVGNPYPSYLDWSDVIADSENAAAGLSTSFWYRTQNTDGAYIFTTHNGTSGEVVGGTTANTIINKFIPPMQAFWIRVNENVGVTSHNTTLKFKNTMREHGVGDNNKFKAPKVDERFRLRLRLENGSVSDETLIYFDANASDNFDNYDSPKMFNNSTLVPDLYSKTTTESLVINGLSELRDNMELPLGFSLNAAASLKLQVSEITNLPTATRVYLLDKVENTQTELHADAAYSFNTSSATLKNESRFSLLFRAPSVNTGLSKGVNNGIKVLVNDVNQIVIFAPENCKYSIYNSLGQKQYENTLLSTKSTVNKIFDAGVYFVSLYSNGQNNIQKVIIR